MNDQLNDIKLKALLFQNGNLTGQIDDEEYTFVQNQIVNPEKDIPINDLWHRLWDEFGVSPGTFNERAKEHILDVIPLTDAEDMNALWLEYWSGLLP